MLSALALVGPLAPVAVGAERPTIQGVGASFPQIEIEQWRADVKRLYDLNVNYTALGSGAGRQQFIGNQGDFSVSDIQFLPGEVNLVKRSFVYVPISAGGLAMMYHLKDGSGKLVTDLKLTAETVCKIFSGQITNWNDPAITGPTGHALKDLAITPVHRADAAGTSYVLGEYCLEQAPAVYNKLLDDYDRLNARNPTARPLAENWPRINGFASDGSNGIADAVAAPDGEGRITAVEFGFAKIRRFPAASVRNASGTFAQPTEENVTRALAFAEVRPNGTHQLHFNGAGAEVYFPSSYSYAIAQTTGFNPDRGFVVASYLNYAVTKGQEKAKALGYAALSANLVKAGLDAIAKIPGAPPRPADVDFNPVDGTQGAAAPPPAAAGGSAGGAGGAAASGAPGPGATAGSAGSAGTAGAAARPGTAAATAARAPAAAASSAGRSSTRVSTGGSAGGAGSVAGLPAGVDPSVDLAVGTFAATGGEQAIEAAVGAALIVGGELMRRRRWPRRLRASVGVRA